MIRWRETLRELNVPERRERERVEPRPAAVPVEAHDERTLPLPIQRPREVRP